MIFKVGQLFEVTQKGVNLCKEDPACRLRKIWGKLVGNEFKIHAVSDNGRFILQIKSTGGVIINATSVSLTHAALFTENDIIFGFIRLVKDVQQETPKESALDLAKALLEVEQQLESTSSTIEDLKSRRASIIAKIKS